MKIKENAKSDFLEMIFKSWTWARLTDQEKVKFVDLINNDNYNISGNYLQRYNAYNFGYFAFLQGLGYKPTGWREAVNG